MCELGWRVYIYIYICFAHQSRYHLLSKRASQASLLRGLEEPDLAVKTGTRSLELTLVG